MSGGFIPGTHGKIRERRRVRKESHPYENTMDAIRSLLQQANLLSRLHQKKVEINYMVKENLQQLVATVWVISGNKVVLEDGKEIPLDSIQEIYIV